MRKADLSFSRLLEPSEQELLYRALGSRWIASIGRDIAPAIAHPRHQRWIRDPANIHRPAHREIQLCLRGEPLRGVEGKVYRLTPGTVVLYDHHEARDWKAPFGQSPARYLWLHFQGRQSLSYNTVETDGEGRSFREITMRIRSGEAAQTIMETWDRCREDPADPLCWALLKSLVSAVLLEILGTARPGTPPNHSRQVVAAVEEYIRNHPAEDLSLDKLSRFAGYSPFFFHRLFVENTGKTPKDYVNQVRLERAKELLKLDHTVEAVTEEIGMASVSYFSRFFKSKIGCTPGRWRRLADPKP